MAIVYRSTAIPAVWVTAVVILMAQVGCRTADWAPPPSSGDRRPAVSDAKPVTAATLYPLSDRAGLFDRTIGVQRPTTIRYRLNATGEDQWRLNFEGVRNVHLQRTAAGHIVIPMEEEQAEAVLVTYEPPIVMLPAQLAVGQPIDHRARMTVNKLQDGSLQDHGWCSYRVELLGTRTVVTPAGTFEATVVQTRRHIELQMAQVLVTSDAAYAPGYGLVLEKITRITKPMNLFEVKQTEELQLTR